MDKIRSFLTGLSLDDTEAAETLGLFQTDGFIESDNDNYLAIEDTARQLGLVE